MQCVISPGNGFDGPEKCMVDVAERLLGPQGVDALSMRDMADIAGQRNTLAVQYHFGGRDQLLIEVFRRRMVAIADDRRAYLTALDAAGRGRELRALVEASILIPPAMSTVNSIKGWWILWRICRRSVPPSASR